uniref:Uncharacterized protein n=1 Tax=Parascaris equorum TaxID=6256 RepID=A0A914S3H0_PAREQ
MKAEARPDTVPPSLMTRFTVSLREKVESLAEVAGGGQVNHWAEPAGDEGITAEQGPKGDALGTEGEVPMPSPGSSGGKAGCLVGKGVVNMRQKGQTVAFREKLL